MWADPRTDCIREPESRPSQRTEGPKLPLVRVGPSRPRRAPLWEASLRVSAVGAATLWTGWDPSSGSLSASPGELLEHADVTRVSCFELLAVAGRGFRPPKILTVDDTPAIEAPRAEPTAVQQGALRPTWSVEYRRIAETAPARVAPFAIYLLGVNPPDGVTDAELAVFNEFYTNVHLPEVAERRHALRAERYERARVIVPPPKGAPRFLAVYECDEASASLRRHVGPSYTAGPDVWQRHTTPWRLWYRRITA